VRGTSGRLVVWWEQEVDNLSLELYKCLRQRLKVIKIKGKSVPEKCIIFSANAFLKDQKIWVFAFDYPLV
jgi:hypothetical protein